MSRRESTPGITRRGLLRGGAAAGTAAALGGVGTASGQSSGVDFGGWFDNVSNFDGIVDERGKDEVEITVGAAGNNGNLAFGPAAVRVDPGTTVVWRWSGQGGTHNVVEETEAWRSGDAVSQAGTTYERTFEEEGVVKYYCSPHKTLGMKGAVVVGDQGANANEPIDFEGWFDNVSNFDGIVDERGKDEVEVTVGAEGNNGNLAFGPAAVRVDPGTTVVWRWNGQGGTHNVVEETEAWRSGDAVSQAGTTYERTFEETGVVKYYCSPHKTLGMKGAVVVGDRGAGVTGGGGGSITLSRNLLMLGGSLGLAAVSPLLFGLFLRYRDPNEDVGPAESTRRQLQRVEEADTTPPVAEEAPLETPEREIEHDDYDPVGTLSLVLVYLLIVGLMWAFMYFVEFLGRGPTVI